MDSDAPLEAFLSAGRSLVSPVVAELGTCRSVASRATTHFDWFPDAGRRIGVDIQAGLDVDIVADVHRLTSSLGRESVDIMISCSSFEHFKYPFLAAHEIMKALRVGGLLFVQTHQSFPLHAYPSDYFRFSTSALEALFPAVMGFEVVDVSYRFPARIESTEAPGVCSASAFLNSNLFGRKIAGTPDDFVYELSDDGR